MAIMRVSKNKDNPYVMIDKRAIGDDRLSWKAKGILGYLLSMPDDWVFYTSELVKHATDGETSFRSGLKELEDAGYITKEQTRDDEGKISGYEWVVYEQPTISRKPTSGKPTSIKQGTTNNNNTNNENTNIKGTDKDSQPSAGISLIEWQEQQKKLQEEKKANNNSHKEVVGALMEVTELDMKIKTNAGRIYKASKELRDAGYGVDDIIEFGRQWKRDWRFKQDGKPPIPETILKEICHVEREDSVEERKRIAFEQIEKARRKS